MRLKFVVEQVPVEIPKERMQAILVEASAQREVVAHPGLRLYGLAELLGQASSAVCLQLFTKCQLYLSTPQNLMLPFAAQLLLL